MRYLATVSYDGTSYAGFQKQQNALGIQTVIERAFRLMTQTEIAIHSSGRTDKGVHALAQRFHFDSHLKLDNDTWLRVNDRLPLDIRILSIKQVNNDFHARYNAKSKKYRYVISKKPSTVFKANYEVYIKNFDIVPVREALPLLEGTHNFKGFCQFVKGKNPIKTMYAVKLKETKTHYIFTFHADAFLKYMVRSIMGTLIEIGTHQLEPDVITKILEMQNRKLAGKTAESRGLYLERVYY